MCGLPHVDTKGNAGGKAFFYLKQGINGDGSVVFPACGGNLLVGNLKRQRVVVNFVLK